MDYQDPDKSLEVFTPKEIAKLLKISSAQVNLMIRRGELPAFRIGRMPRVKGKDIYEFIEKNLVRGGDEIF